MPSLRVCTKRVLKAAYHSTHMYAIHPHTHFYTDPGVLFDLFYTSIFLFTIFTVEGLSHCDR